MYMYVKTSLHVILQEPQVVSLRLNIFNYREIHFVSLTITYYVYRYEYFVCQLLYIF